MARLTEQYLDDLRERLRDPDEAISYLTVAIEDGDVSTFLLALRDVAEAQGLKHVAAKAGLNRENLYRILSSSGNPRLTSLLAILEALGVRNQTAAQFFTHHPTASSSATRTIEIRAAESALTEPVGYFVGHFPGATPPGLWRSGNHEPKCEPLAA